MSMPRQPEKVLIYHITDVSNLTNIIAAGGLHSDAKMHSDPPQGLPPTIIGYLNIKRRRMYNAKVQCCNDKKVGEFVPFYFCPRSPMLYTINRGNTGRTPGCQSTIVHLVSRLSRAIEHCSDWAISNRNAADSDASFFCGLSGLDQLNWNAIEARIWNNVMSEKMAEFLAADFFPWSIIHHIGVANAAIQIQVENMVASARIKPWIDIQPSWYYEKNE
jgi:hypothetical protein